jgi:hypothetical protein
MLQSAAVFIQRFWCCTRVREELIDTQNSTATLLQAVVRRRLVLCQYMALLRATVTVQSFVRMQQQQIQLQTLGQLVVSLQACWRRALARENVRRVRTCLSAVVRIQQFWRNVLARTQESASTVIQAMARGSFARSQFSRLYSACLVVQSIARMRQRQLQVLTLRQIVIYVQACWRGALARDRFRRVATCQRAAVRIRCIGRGLLARERLAFAQESASILLFQAVVRGVLVRFQFAKMYRACVTIQLAARMQQQRLQLSTLRQLVVIIQACWRGALVRDAYSRVQACQMAAICLQQFWRNVIHRHLACAREESTSAVKIQAVVRGRLHRSQFLSLCCSCLTIQSVARIIQQQLQLWTLRHIVIYIQAYWQGTLV